RISCGRRVGREVIDLGYLTLPVAVDAANALFQPGRVERDVDVDQPMAISLQVNALARGVRGDEHAHVVLARVLSELGADLLAFLWRGRALDGGQHLLVAALR